MNVGSIALQARTPSMTIATSGCGKRAPGSLFDPIAARRAAPTPMPATPAQAALPASAMPILTAQASGAPAAPAAPLSSRLSFLARLADITKA
ncbi:MAG: hypothetical protein H6872_10440 [Methylobacteriaceae bacterium]|nr:hypothetical protein [Rhodoblastus sp.]MCC0005536.1 hypothetical protein [Methylobacteriaceae bacterium]